MTEKIMSNFFDPKKINYPHLSDKVGGYYREHKNVSINLGELYFKLFCCYISCCSCCLDY
jgi:hypothetical protein